MGRVVQTFLLMFVAVPAVWVPARALQKPQPPPPDEKVERVNACSLLTRDEVKKLVPWAPMLDQFPTDEESIGTSGSACSYPGVHIQVLSFSPGTIEAARKRGKLESLSGVGDEAYLYENPNGYLELYARVGKHLVTIQKSVRADEKMESVRSGVVALAKALAAKTALTGSR